MPRASSAVRVVTVVSWADGSATVTADGTTNLRVPAPTEMEPGSLGLLLRTPGGSQVAVPLGGSGGGGGTQPSGFARYLYADLDAVGDPGTGHVYVHKGSGDDRVLCFSSLDADGVARAVQVVTPGDNVTITDDPTSPPITGFARYVVTAEPVDQGTWWEIPAERTDTTGSQTPPPQDTPVRAYLSGAAAPTDLYVKRAGDTMTGTLSVPRLEIRSEDEATRFQLDTYGSGLADTLYLGLTTGAGLGVNSQGVPLVNVPGDNVYRVLDTRDLGASNPYVPSRQLDSADDLNNLSAGLYWWQGASGDPANVPRPYIPGKDGRWALVQYGNAPIGNPGLDQGWQIAYHHDEVWVRSASFMFATRGWRRLPTSVESTVLHTEASNGAGAGVALGTSATLIANATDQLTIPAGYRGTVHWTLFGHAHCASASTGVAQVWPQFRLNGGSWTDLVSSPAWGATAYKLNMPLGVRQLFHASGTFANRGAGVYDFRYVGTRSDSFAHTVYLTRCLFDIHLTLDPSLFAAEAEVLPT